MYKPLKPAEYAALLEGYIAHLDGEIAALSPSGWPVPSLLESYSGAEASKHLGQAYESAMIDLALAKHQAGLDKAWADKKIAHLYA